MTTVIPQHHRAAGHFHTDAPLVQIGWQGQSGTIYSLADDCAPLEPGGISPIYARWGEQCGHQIEATESTVSTDAFDLVQHLFRQRTFSERTFGPGARVDGVLDHIRKELREIEDVRGADLEEWVDVVILALDGAWRSGATPGEIAAMIVAKQAKNEARSWPDWRTADPGKAIEHVHTEVDAA